MVSLARLEPEGNLLCVRQAKRRVTDQAKGSCSVTESNKESARRLEELHRMEDVLAMELMLINAEMLEKRRRSAAEFIAILGQRTFF